MIEVTKQITSDALEDGGKLLPSQSFGPSGLDVDDKPTYPNKGLRLTPPALADKLIDGALDLVVRPQDLDIANQTVLLLKQGKALGVIKVGDKTEISKEEFASLEHKHQISPAMLASWGEIQPSWLGDKLNAWPVHVLIRFVTPMVTDAAVGPDLVVSGVNVRQAKETPVGKAIWGSPAGKTKIAKRLAAMLQPHTTYVEPFVGSGAVLFEKEPSKVEAINDADPEIADSFKTLKALTEPQLEKLKKKSWVGDKATYGTLFKGAFKDAIDKLYRFLYMAHFSYGKLRKGSFNPGAQGVQASMGDRVEKMAPRLKNVQIFNGDYKPVIEKFDGEDTMFFLDPPYAGYNANVGESKFNEEEFFDTLKAIKGKFLITYGIRGKLPGLVRKEKTFHVKQIRPARSIRTMRGVGGSKFLTQLIISNYEVVSKAIESDAEWEIVPWTKADEDAAKIQDVDNYNPAGQNDEQLRDDFRILLAWYASWKKDPKEFVHPLETIETLLRKVLLELVRRGPEIIRFNPAGMEDSVRSFFQQVARDVKVPQAMYKSLDLRVDTEPEELTNEELLEAHWTLHHMFEKESESQQAIAGWSTEDLVNLHSRIVDELYNRSKRHPPPPDDGLDELSGDFEQHAEQQPKWYEIQARVAKGTYATINRSGNKLGGKITIEEVLPHFETFKARRPYIYLVGGLANHGSTEGDIDILVNDSEDTPEWLKDVIEFRIGRCLPAELSKRVQVHYDRDRGPFTNFVELFDLHLERVNHSNEVKEMRLVTNVVELYKAQPFGTYGGSHTYAKQLSLLIPEHKVYVEPFAGAAALLHAKKISDKEVLADYDDDVVFLHRFIKGMTEEKLDKLRAFNWKCTKSSWASVLKMEPKNEFERFYRLAFIRRFGYNSRPNATHPSGSALGTTNKLDKYLPAAERLKNVSIVKQDYHKTIADYDGPDTFFFIDPPYPGEWWNKSAVIDLEDFIETLKKIKGRYVAVINDAPDNVSAFKQNGQVFWLNINEALGTGGTKKASRLFCANYKISKKADVIHAQKAVEQGSITIGEFFYQPKPTRPAYPGERQSVDGLIKLYGDHPDWLPTIAQKKYDGCLPWYAKVETELGSVPIGRLVETKARIRVKSYSFEREVVEWKSITDHFYNGKAEGYLRIAVSGNRGTLTCTPNHFVFLADGSKVEAESLRVGNCICFRSARLSEQQESFIRGTLLGDSCLCRNLSKTFPSLPLLTCSHGSKQGEYLEWKASILASLGGRVSSRVSQYGFPGLRWISRSDAALLKFWDELYPDGKKRITAEFLSKLSPVSWATWIMDDGSLAWNVKPRLHLHTEGYSRAENELIKKYFEEFGCCVSVYEQRGYFFLAFSSGSTEWLLEQVRPWFHQSLAYKAGEVSGKLGTSWNDTVIFNGEQVSAREIVNIEPFVPARERGRYDIEVEGNHNYFVNGILVSNSNHQIHKDGDKVTIYSEDGDDNTDRLPGVVDAVRKLAPAKLVIVAEIERWQAGQHLPRETVAGYLNSKDEPDDSELVANVYDVLVQNDEQLHKEGTSKRIDALGKLKLGQSTTGVPNLKFRLNAAPSEVVEDLEDLRKTTERYRRLPGSEGAVFKQSDAPYTIAQVTPDTWVKFHNSTEVHGIVCGRERTEGGVWVYQYGILPGKDDPVETEDVGGKKVVPVGDSFATKLDIADGDPITIEAETVNIERSKDGIAVSAWVPRVIDTAPKPPDTVDKLSARARADLVLQEKDLAESGEIRYRPVHRAQVSKRKTAAAMLIELGPPSEWSGAVASAIGDDGRKRVKALWNALNESERKKVSEAFDKMFDATDVILDIEQSHGKIAKRLVTKQADPYLEVPPEGRKYQYSVQHHWRGKGFHADLRLEMKPGKLLAGWTLNTMITGVVKEPVTTLADAKAAVSDMNKVSKINWDTGEWAKRPKAGTDKLVRAEILCFAGSMEVLTRQGFRPIANVKVGDEVLSVDGGFHRVGGVMRRPAPKRLFDVKVRGVERLRATPEHPMLAVRRPFEEALDQLSQPRRDELFGKLATAVPEWLPISELRSGDYLVCPRPKFQADVSPVRLRDRNGYRKEIKVTPSFLRFVGFWIGDGSATNGNVIRLYFNGRTERALAEEYLSILEEIECSPTIHQRDPSHLTVQLHDPTLARWLVKNCGSGTQYKTIPEQWLGLDEANWSSLWQGLVDSDGWRDAHAEHLSNTSKLLIGRTIAQWHFLGVDVSYRLRSQLGYGTNKIYQLSHLSEKIGRMNVVTENHVLRRVLSVEEFSRTDATRRIDEVFNLEVEDSQTYTVHSIGVHNCERKAPEPYAWLHVEGKTKDPEEGQAPPVGGTRQYPGVFHIVDQGSFEYGSQKSWFHEYFFHGDALNYRMFFRLLRIAKRDEQLECAACGQSGPATLIGWAGEELTSMCPTCVDEFVSKQGVVLPPSEEQPIGDQSSWLAIYPDDQLPYVLDAEAVKKEWMPPDGYSALPAAMRSKIPPQYRYWTKSGNSARTIRDELVQAMKDGDIVIDAAAPFEKVRKASLLDADFVFQEQTWKGQTQVRIGPSRTRWWVRLDVGKPKLMVFDLATNPLDNDQVAAVVTEDPRKATMEVSGDVPPGHYMNPTKQTSSQVEVVDSGKASVTTLSDDLIKVQFDGKALKGVYTLTRNNGEYLWSKAKGAPDTTEKRVSEVEIQFVIPIHHVEVKKSADGTEKRLVTGIALEPNETDAQGDWIKAEAIEKTAHDFLRNYNKTTGMGLMHKAFGDIGIELVESSIAPFDYKVGVKPVKKGSWVVTVHVSSDKRWEEVKNGTLTGFSVGGLATVEGKS